MLAETLITKIQALGVELVPVGPDRLRIRPASAVPPELRAQLVEHKAEVLRVLTGQPHPASWPPPTVDLARLIAAPLGVFAHSGQPIEVQVGWWPSTLFFVPTARVAKALEDEGITRARIWTAAELLSVLGPPALSVEALSIVQLVRQEFGGEVVAVRERPAEAGAESFGHNRANRGTTGPEAGK